MSASADEIREDIRRRLSNPEALRANIRERLSAVAARDPASTGGSDARRNPLEQEQVRRRIRENDEMRSARGQAIRTGTGGFIAGILSIPHAAGELVALADAGIGTVVGAGIDAIQGKPINLGERWEKNRFLAETFNPLAASLMQAPDPSAEDVLTVTGTVKNLPGELLDTPLSPVDATGRAYSRARTFEEEQAAAHPIATGIGQAGADIATLLTLRPRLKNLFRREEIPRIDPAVAEQANAAANKLASALGLVQRGAGRTAEAGFEGALIAALGEGDPAATAGWSAGVQGLGSIGLALKSKFFRTIPNTFFNLWLGHEMYRAVAPGPQDAFGSKDQVVREFIGAYGLGLLARLVGANRGAAANTMVDRIATANRAAVASVATQLQDADDSGDHRYSQVIGRLMEDPNYFGRASREHIEEAAASEEPNALLDAIDSLFRTERFRSLFEKISGSDVPASE